MALAWTEPPFQKKLCTYLPFTSRRAQRRPPRDAQTHLQFEKGGAEAPLSPYRIVFGSSTFFSCCSDSEGCEITTGSFWIVSATVISGFSGSAEEGSEAVEASTLFGTDSGCGGDCMVCSEAISRFVVSIAGGA